MVSQSSSLIVQVAAVLFAKERKRTENNMGSLEKGGGSNRRYLLDQEQPVYYRRWECQQPGNEHLKVPSGKTVDMHAVSSMSVGLCLGSWGVFGDFHWLQTLQPEALVLPRLQADVRFHFMMHSLAPASNVRTPCCEVVASNVVAIHGCGCVGSRVESRKEEKMTTPKSEEEVKQAEFRKPHKKHEI